MGGDSLKSDGGTSTPTSPPGRCSPVLTPLLCKPAAPLLLWGCSKPLAGGWYTWQSSRAALTFQPPDLITLGNKNPLSTPCRAPALPGTCKQALPRATASVASWSRADHHPVGTHSFTCLLLRPYGIYADSCRLHMLLRCQIATVGMAPCTSTGGA